MDRQQAVIDALVEGFAGKSQLQPLYDNGVRIDVEGIEGYFEVDAKGGVKFPENLDAEVAYWICIDLASLDIQRDTTKAALQKEE